MKAPMVRLKPTTPNINTPIQMECLKQKKRVVSRQKYASYEIDSLKKTIHQEEYWLEKLQERLL